MTVERNPDTAEHLLQTALTHPECTGGAVLAPVGGVPRVRLDMNVEMPLHMKADGISVSGVRTTESVVLELPQDYPWQSPHFYFREDFPRNFPHLYPFGARPRPCLVDGDQDEFFLQFGLAEYGVFHLVEQLAIWLRKAALQNLIDPDQGWEPAVRRNLGNIVELDAEAVRDVVTKNGGWVTWRARFYRRGPAIATLATGVKAWLSSKGEPTPLLGRPDDKNFAQHRRQQDLAFGNSVVGIIWPDKNPDGSKFVSASYLPESVETLGALRARAAELGCGRGLATFLSNLERSFAGMHLGAPIPIGIVLCARRPHHLIGSSSEIEVLPYLVEIRPDQERLSLFAQGDAEPVESAMHYQSLTASLLRGVSGLPERPALAMLGCGSVGSKLTLHAARAGQEIVAVNDEALLLPHNMARHALGPSYVARNKAEALAEELAEFGASPTVYRESLVTGLRDARDKIIPKSARAAVNSTASLAVREALTAAADPSFRPKLFEAALFGRGHGAFLLIDGKAHNPTHCDLMAEMYATLESDRAARLLFDPAEGLGRIQIGQGCGSLTMKMGDARLSAMTAALSLEISTAVDKPADDGVIVIGTAEEDDPSTHWTRQAVSPFETVTIAGCDGWELRISARVAERIRAEAKSYAGVETGGIIIGLASARLKTITVVDLLDAPPDSRRTPTMFVLGTDGMQKSILDRHIASGQTLFDVGTWHSHLADVGPSSTDWQTATDLAVERTPPSVLLIVTPKRFFALISTRKLS